MEFEETENIDTLKKELAYIQEQFADMETAFDKVLNKYSILAGYVIEESIKNYDYKQQPLSYYLEESNLKELYSNMKRAGISIDRLKFELTSKWNKANNVDII